jgi:long-chain acyl-CoA synthetase
VERVGILRASWRRRAPCFSRRPPAEYNLSAISSSNFYILFADAAARVPDRVAAELVRRDGVEALTYGELRALAERASAWLAAHGIGAGARVALLAENDGPWCGAYLGVMRAGAVAVPLDTTYTAAQVRVLLQDCGASAVLTSRRFAHVVAEALRGSPLPQALIDDRFVGFDRAPIQASLASECPAVILYTSGTTADPKGVVLTHGNLNAERSAAFRVVQVDERDTVLSVLPLFHALAQLANLLLPFSVGAKVVFLETVNTTELTRALRERNVTAFVCVPQFFYLLRHRIDQQIAALPFAVRSLVKTLAAANLRARRLLGLNPGRLVFGRIHRALGPRLRLLITGGARFDPAVNTALYALGFTIRQAYGLTECAGAATITADAESHLDSVGRPMPGVEVRILHDDTEGTVGEGVPPGEICIRGPIVMRGYFNRPDQNAETLRDGWLHTGDLGHLDPSGRLYVTGRRKEVIVLGSGKNIYPEEIEAHYERSPFIQEVCVVGRSRPGEPASERLHALIRPDADALRARGAVNIRELVRFELESLSVQLPPHKRILQYDVTVDPLPRTTTRKLKRFEIEKILEERAEKAESAEAQRGGGAEAQREWPDDPRTAWILKVAREALRPDVVLLPGAHLELDLGLDSMERVELLVHLTASLGIEIGDEDAQAIQTVGELVGACRARVGDALEAVERVAPWERLLLQPPTDPTIAQELTKPKRVRAVVLFALVKAMDALFRLTTGLRSGGTGNLPRTGPFIISPNHQSYVDAFMLVGALPFPVFRQLFFVGAAEYFASPFMRWLARTLNIVPVDPDANLVGAMQAGAHGLRLERVLVLFPEGERSIDGEVKAFRKGVAILSHHLRVPVVPVAIDGAWEIWPRGRALDWRRLLPWNRTRARIEFGSPIPAPPTAEYLRHAEELRARVLNLWDALHRERLR